MTLIMELKNPVDYFPYIGHELDQEKLRKAKLWKNVIGSLLEEKHITRQGNEIFVLGGENVPLFREVRIKGVREQQKIAQDSFSVCAVVPRHRSLYDYGIGMPVHSQFINQEVMLLAGSNLFVEGYDTMLRHYGAFMFLREDTILKKKGYPNVFLSITRYLQEVFPAYLNHQMFEGVGKNKLKHDMIVYPGQEKDPVTKKRNGGRSKSGRLRELSPLIFENFRKLTRESSTRLFISPVSVSFNKYPDAIFIVHPSKHSGIVKDLRYLHEQNLVGSWYPQYAKRHPEAKLEVIVNYGKPEPFDGADYKSFRDILAYTKGLKDRIGRLESIFPSLLLYRALDTQSELSLSDLESRSKKLYDHYLERGVNVEKISSAPGIMMPIREMVDRAVTTLNTNPAYRIFGLKTDEFVTLESGRFISLDMNLQEWYANNIRHLDA